LNSNKTVTSEDSGTISSIIRNRGTTYGSSGDSGSGGPPTARSTFTRSRSPVITRPPATRRHLSPSSNRPSRKTSIPIPTHLFPSLLEFKIPLWPTSWVYAFSADFRKCGESHILIGATLYAVLMIYLVPCNPIYAETNKWIVEGLLCESWSSQLTRLHIQICLFLAPLLSFIAYGLIVRCLNLPSSKSNLHRHLRVRNPTLNRLYTLATPNQRTINVSTLPRNRILVTYG
jgi:hypothetical protein